MKRLYSTVAVTALAVAIMSASAFAATKAQPKTPGGVCQGTIGYVTGSTFAGGSRDERQISFSIRAKSAREVQIFNVQGTAVLKPGNYLAAPAGKDVSVTFSFRDHLNNFRTMDLTFDRDGSFSGSTGQTQLSNPGTDMMCGLMGMDCSSLMPTMSIEMSGICADAN